MFASVTIFIDGFPASLSALQAGVEMGRAVGARIKGVFVEDELRFMHFPPITTVSAAIGAAPALPVPLPPEQMAEVEAGLTAERETIEREFSAACDKAGVKGAFAAVRGDLVTEMLRQSHTTDLVVMGCRGSTHPGGSTNPGSKIEPLLRHTPRPVLLVPQGQWRHSPILFAYDGGMGALRALAAGAAVAKAHGSAVEVMVATTDHDRADLLLAECRDYLAPYGLIANYHHANTNSAATAIVDRARAVNAHLISMGAFGTNRIKEWIFGSATRSILENLPCPVLLTRP